MKKLRVFFALLLGSLKLLLAFLPETLLLPSSVSSKVMRRLITADKISVGFKYFDGEKELGNVRYNMVDGYFHVFTWPSSFNALKKATELLKLLGFAVRIIKSEKA